MNQTRKELDRRLSELVQERSTFERYWWDIADEILPYRARRYDNRIGKGQRKNPRKINSKPARALRVYVAGMMAGMTSPSRLWFRLTTHDTELAKSHAVRSYLDAVERAIMESLSRAGWYEALANGVYRDLGLIATAAVFQEEKADRMRFEPLTIGEYYLDVDPEGGVDTIFRKRPMTVRNIVQRFGLDAVSPMTRRAYEGGKLDTRLDVIQAVYPNGEFTEGSPGPAGFEYVSKWWERTAKQGWLHIGGYHEFPAHCPRWNHVAGEVYGRGSPGWEVVGDCKALQHSERRLAGLIDKTVDPPMRATDALRSARASLLPGDITYVPAGSGAHEFTPAVQIQPQAIQVMLAHIQRHEQRIEEGFFVDLWLSLISDKRQQRATATEVQATRQEVMLQLGPLLENLNTGLLAPCIHRTFAILQRQGKLPLPPQELQGSDGAIKVEFISVMHQAQKMTGLVGVRDLVSEVAALAQSGKAEALDKLNADAIVDEVADMLGIKPDLILAEDKVEALRHARAQQEQAQQQGQAMLAASQGVKNVGTADPQKVSAIASMISPVAAAQGGLS